MILKEGDVKSLELRKIQLLTFHELILEDRLNINHLFILVLVSETNREVAKAVST